MIEDLGIRHQEAQAALCSVFAAKHALREAKRHARSREAKRQLAGFVCALESIEDTLRQDALKLRGMIR